VPEVTAETLHSQAYFDDPFGVWEQLRHEAPLFYDSIDDRWLLTRYHDVTAVFRDHSVYSARPYERIFTDVIGPTMVQMDGKDHDVRRSIVAPVMVGRTLEQNYQPLIDAVVAGLLEDLPAQGTVDLIGSVTSPLPLKVVATMLGMPESYDGYLHGVAALVIAALAGVEPAKSDGRAKHLEFAGQIDALISARIEDPRPDLITGITQGRSESGEQLSREEIASFISLLLVAGGETTDRALANFWYVLMTEPDVMAAVRGDPSLLGAAFSEFMRRDGVVVYEDRELTSDVEWYGQAIPAGAIVRVALMSANNDETVFADPRRFDLNRSDLNLGPEKRPGGIRDGVANHVGFGLGKHFCIGYHLARAEVTAATAALLDRYRELAFLPGQQPRLQVNWFHRHLDHLRVSVTG